MSMITALVIAAQMAGPVATTEQVDTVKISQAVLAEMQRTRAPGVAVGVVVDGRLVFARGYGTATVEHDAPVQPSTLFRIGSVTKVITGLSVLGVEQSGRVSLQQPIGTYWPALHASLRPITLRQLLTHTAGMTQLASAYGPSDEEALQRRLAGWTDSMVFAQPGEIYSYSSPGYWLAAAVAERAEGAKYSELVRRHVFDPLGMNASTFDPLVAFTRPVALDHRRNPQGAPLVVRPYPNDASTWPGGSAFSSVADLSRLAIALMNDGRIDERQAIGAQIARAVLTRQTENAGGSCGYTFGLGFCVAGADTIVSHYGFRSGTGAVFTIVPTRRAAVIILANIGGGIFFQTERAILDMFGVAREPNADPVLREIPRSDFSRIAGTYVAGGDTLRIQERDARLVLAAPEPQPLRWGAPNELFVMDGQGNPIGRWVLVQSPKGNWFLSDGLNAFRRVQAPSRPR